MSTFIKTGFWEKSKEGYKGWLNLDTLVSTITSIYQKIVNPSVSLTDAATIDIDAVKNTLTTSSATRTFTISYTGDSSITEVTLNNTGAVFTFPATALCVADGVASGDNTLTLAGVSGDKYLIGIVKIGNNYSVVSRNFGQ